MRKKKKIGFKRVRSHRGRAMRKMKEDKSERRHVRQDVGGRDRGRGEGKEAGGKETREAGCKKQESRQGCGARRKEAG